jgi:hypothetical protein
MLSSFNFYLKLLTWIFFVLSLPLIVNFLFFCVLLMLKNLP